MPLQPNSPKLPLFCGMNGTQCPRSMYMAPTTITTQTTNSLKTTITLLTQADSLVPTISNAVSATTTSTAGILAIPTAEVPSASFTASPVACAHCGGR